MKNYFLLLLFLTTTLFSLPSEVKLDMLKVQLKEQIQNKQYSNSVTTFQNIRKYGEKLPNNFDYYEGKVNFEINNYSKSYTLLEKYIKNTGVKGTYYKSVLTILIQLENKENEAWNSIQTSDDENDFLYFINKYTYSKNLFMAKEKVINIIKNKQKVKIYKSNNKVENIKVQTKKQKQKQKQNFYYKKNDILMWQDSHFVPKRNFKDANNYCNNLILNNKSNWRLPKYFELLKIVDYLNYKPSIKKGFQRTFSKYYWTSSIVQSYAKKSYGVSFMNGSSNTFNQNEKLYVRCVRNAK